MKKASSPDTSVSVAYGSEGYFLDSVVVSAMAWSGREVRRLDGSELTDIEVLDQLRESHYEGRPVTVIVDHAEGVKEGKEKRLRTFLQGVAATDLSAVLVAVVRDSKLPDLWESVVKTKATHYPKLRSIGEGKKNEVLSYIKERVIKFGLAFDDGMDLEFYKATGGDLYNINNELRKLAVLASVTGSQKITAKAIGAVVSPHMLAEPWTIAEAAFNKERKSAMRMVSYLFENEPDKAPTRISAALIRELQQVMFARSLLDGGMNPAEIAGVIDMNPWRCKEIFLPRVRKHTQKQLMGLMTRLCTLDADVKSGARSKRTLVELAVLAIAA